MRTEKIKAHRKIVDKETARIHRLIDMRADEELSKEDFAKKRELAEKKKDYALSMINKIERDNKAFVDKLDEVFSFVTNVKNKFLNGSPEEKKVILLKLGSNLQICDKKLMISLDLRLKPFEKYSERVREEFKSVEPLKNSLDKRKTASFETAFPVMSTEGDGSRTFWFDILVREVKTTCKII